jgi:hypothetical protein
MHHYFRLCFSVAPGGAHKDEFHVVGTLAEVKDAAQADLGSPMGAYLAIFYGETILLECWEDNHEVAVIDLHPFITYRLSDSDEPLRFPGDGDAPLLDLEENEERTDALLDGEIAVQVVIDWDRVVLPALGGAPLPVGKDPQSATPERPETEGWSYGFHDNEAC